MAVGSAFGALTELIERLEATDREVLGVVTEDIGTGGDDSLVVDLSVSTPLFGDIDTSELELTARSASVNEDGTATVDLAVSIPRSVRAVSAAPTSRNGSNGGDSQRSGRSADRGRNGDVPVHRDPGRLREVYAACDTFAEMTDALGADVTSVTVRRNMIKHGIHEPRSNGSSSGTDDGETDAAPDSGSGPDADADSDVGSGGEVSDDNVTARADDHATDDRVPADASAPSTDDLPVVDDASSSDIAVLDETTAPDETPDSSLEHSTSSNEEPATGEGESAESVDEAVAIPDGIGFPHGLTLDRLTEVISTSKTLHEAQTQLGLDRDRTRELLDDLGVLDLVHGRVSTRHERAASSEEIDERIRERLSRTT